MPNQQPEQELVDNFVKRILEMDITTNEKNI